MPFKVAKSASDHFVRHFTTAVRHAQAACALATLALVGALLWCDVARAGGAEPDAAGTQAGMLKVVQGDVQVQRRGSASPQPVKVGDRVFAGDRVLTAADAAAGITLRDDTLMSLGPRSNVVLEQFNFDADGGDGNVVVRVLKGTMRYVTGLIGKHAPAHQQVLTPTATIGIRGTDFIVEVESSE